MAYHGPNRVSSSISFYGNSGAFVVPADTTAELQVGFDPAWTLQPIATQYICQVVDVGTSPRHVTAFLPNYDATPGAPFIHHMLVHQCGNSLTDLQSAKLYTTPTPCQSSDPTEQGNSPLGISVCRSLIYMNAVGGGGLDLPAQVGFLVGTGGSRYLVIEAHVNNPGLTSGTPISKLVKVALTTKLRQNNAGVLAVGTASGAPLPPSQSAKPFQVTCPRLVTYTFTGALSVFSSALHMHQVGKQAWSTKYAYASPYSSTPSSKVVYDYREFWNFAFQTYSPVSLTISPGDQINMHCVYDTSKRTSPVYFGPTSSDEMCFDFLFYYPLENTNGLGVCGVSSSLFDDSDKTLPASIHVFGVSGSPSWSASPNTIPTNAPLSAKPTYQPSRSPITKPTASPTSVNTNTPVLGSNVRNGVSSTAQLHFSYCLMIIVTIFFSLS